MQYRTSLGVGPLSAAARGLADGGAAPPAGQPDPAAFFARLMDLRGSVDLAQRLSAIDRARAPEFAASDREAAARLRAEIAARFDAVRDDLARPYADPFHRRNKLPTPEGVVGVLVDGGALRERRGKAVAAAADAVWSPCADLLGRSLDRVRFEIAALREEVAPALAALGPAVARLERLDAALFGATIRGRQQVEDRLLAAVGRSFAARFSAAVAALPGATAPAHVAPWFAPGGLLCAEILRGRDVIAGVLTHDRRRIEALVEVRGSA